VSHEWVRRRFPPWDGGALVFCTVTLIIALVRRVDDEAHRLFILAACRTEM
jgi:hypothetical protein